MVTPPEGTRCSECRAALAAVRAGEDWLCWECDERASERPLQAAQREREQPLRVEIEAEDGVELIRGRLFPYDELWQQLRGAPRSAFVGVTFESASVALRATRALEKRAKRQGVELEHGRDRTTPLKRRYRLKG